MVYRKRSRERPQRARRFSAGGPAPRTILCSVTGLVSQGCAAIQATASFSEGNFPKWRTLPSDHCIWTRQTRPFFTGDRIVLLTPRDASKLRAEANLHDRAVNLRPPPNCNIKILRALRQSHRKRPGRRAQDIKARRGGLRRTSPSCESCSAKTKAPLPAALVYRKKSCERPQRARRFSAGGPAPRTILCSAAGLVSQE